MGKGISLKGAEAGTKKRICSRRQRQTRAFMEVTDSELSKGCGRNGETTNDGEPTTMPQRRRTPTTDQDGSSNTDTDGYK